MLFVRDKLVGRQNKIRKFLNSEDFGLAPLLAAIDFEWTVRRAIISLSTMPSVDIRNRLRGCKGYPGYAKAWKTHVASTKNKTLHEVVGDQKTIDRGFGLRNKLAHGVIGTTSKDLAEELTEGMLQATSSIIGFAKHHGVDLYQPLKGRPRPRKKKSGVSNG